MVFVKGKENFYFGASEEIIKRARVLRKTMTVAETKLWQYLQNNQFHGLKFRRQHPINRFIVDFYCHTLKLVIEIDGGVHLQEIQHERDVNRTYELNELGLKVIRFENKIVMTNIAGVLQGIEKYMNTL
jgi:very-short-patch-repair endonuclease